MNLISTGGSESLGIVRQLARRREEEEARGIDAWTPHAARSRHVSTALSAYGMLASSADRGGVRDLSQIRPVAD